MRRRQQKNIKEFLKAIQEAQAEKEYASCQEGALSLCDFIDNLTGGGTNTAELLDEYCELLFKAHNGEIGEKLLRKQMIKIENSINYELKPNKTEIVFISYKASMSDSIETIYLAAKADSSCDAYWIPVPYFEFSPDRTNYETVYEGAEYYPDYIECTDWQQYDFEKRRPDVVFTFAPYDANNFVTSVHPDFYCERLSKYTDMLVYVSYGLELVTVREEFCALPGCLFSDIVIATSNGIRKKYIDIFTRYKDMFGKPEDKFIALGTPKFDKVINTKREDCCIPFNWKEIISGRKVIFFNSTITSFLNGSEYYLEKLRHILNTFRNRTDIAVWWRPHPLLEATCKSMRPNLLNEYIEIVEEYKENNFGIYDNTSDLHRAIACTDAFYGDRSSIPTLYAVTGKPVMLRSKEIIMYDESLSESLCQFKTITDNALLTDLENINKFHYFEGKPFNLDNFIDYIVKCNDTMEYADLITKRKEAVGCMAVNIGKAGQEIYNYVKGKAINND